LKPCLVAAGWGSTYNWLIKSLGSIFVVLAIAALASASAAPAKERWRVVARATDTGDQIAVAAAAKRQTTRLAVRVRVTGEPKKAELHTVVTCSKATGLGRRVFSRRDAFTVTAPAMRVLRLPIGYPENCGVIAIGIGRIFSPRGRITVEILARCTVQTFPAAKGKCI
jgi:hypothetical protein